MKDVLEGKVCLVTGGGGGIGAAISLLLGQSGARIAVVDRDLEGAARSADEIGSTGGSAVAIQSDISIASERIRAYEQAQEAFGAIDILVNNAADHGSRSKFLDVSIEEWERILSTNLSATWHFSQLVAPQMIEKQEGSIINLGAIQASLPVATYASYVATKGGILSLTKALAVELSQYGVRVNAISPGAIASPSTQSALSNLGTNQKAPTLLGRMGTSHDVAQGVLFLASPASSFVTGENIVIDGGRSLSRDPDPFASFSNRT
ncbi:MAG: SDR family oxidoreductase [Actinomycetota bacterium]|nr:SDR family oxidoreductase [Actinomycetota bacterium]